MIVSLDGKVYLRALQTIKPLKERGEKKRQADTKLMFLPGWILLTYTVKAQAYRYKPPDFSLQTLQTMMLGMFCYLAQNSTSFLEVQSGRGP